MIVCFGYHREQYLPAGDLYESMTAKKRSAEYPGGVFDGASL